MSAYIVRHRFLLHSFLSVVVADIIDHFQIAFVFEYMYVEISTAHFDSKRSGSHIDFVVKQLVGISAYCFEEAAEHTVEYKLAHDSLS